MTTLPQDAQAVCNGRLLGVQIAKLVKSQLKTIAEERKTLIAEERQNLEKLLVAISSSINRDLPQRIEDILKREVSGVTSAVGSAVQAALAEALPRELASGTLQARLLKEARIISCSMVTAVLNAYPHGSLPFTSHADRACRPHWNGRWPPSSSWPWPSPCRKASAPASSSRSCRHSRLPARTCLLRCVPWQCTGSDFHPFTSCTPRFDCDGSPVVLRGRCKPPLPEAWRSTWRRQAEPMPLSCHR